MENCRLEKIFVGFMVPIVIYRKTDNLPLQITIQNSGNRPKFVLITIHLSIVLKLFEHFFQIQMMLGIWFTNANFSCKLTLPVSLG